MCETLFLNRNSLNLCTLEDIGRITETSVADIIHIANNISLYYKKPIYETKLNGRVRRFDPPKKPLKRIQKTINNAKELSKPDGTVFVIAKCQEGIGENKAFGNWLSSLKNLENLIQIKEDTIELGQYTAMNTSKLQRKYRIVILSELAQDELEKYNFLWTSSIDSTIKNCAQLYGDNFKTYVVPNGGLIYPKLRH